MSEPSELQLRADAVVSASAEVADRKRDVIDIERDVRAANERLSNARAKVALAEKAFEEARGALDKELDR